MSSTSRPTASEIRDPVEYSSSSSARLRNVSGPSDASFAAGAFQQRQHLVDGQALGQPPARRRRPDRPRHVQFGQPLGGGEPMQPTHRDQRPRRRDRRQRHRAGFGIPPAQRHQELADVVLADLGQIVDSPSDQCFE